MLNLNSTNLTLDDRVCILTAILLIPNIHVPDNVAEPYVKAAYKMLTHDPSYVIIDGGEV